MEPENLLDVESQEGDAPPAFLSELPSGTAPDPAAQLQADNDARFVPREQFDALNNSFRALGPIAEALAANPTLAENLRHQLATGQITAPAPPPLQQQQQPVQQQPVALTPDQLEKLRVAVLDDPLGFTTRVAQMQARQIVAAEMAPYRTQMVETKMDLFQSAKLRANADEYAAVTPYFQAAMQGVDVAQLANNPAALQQFLEVTWRASRGDMYADAVKRDNLETAGRQPQLAQAPGAQAPRLQSVPQYGGGGGAPAASAGQGLIRRAQRSNADPAVTAMQADLAKRSGLTQADFAKYGGDVQNEIAN